MINKYFSPPTQSSSIQDFKDFLSERKFGSVTALDNQKVKCYTHKTSMSIADSNESLAQILEKSDSAQKQQLQLQQPARKIFVSGIKSILAVANQQQQLKKIHMSPQKRNQLAAFLAIKFESLKNRQQEEQQSDRMHRDFACSQGVDQLRRLYQTPLKKRAAASHHNLINKIWNINDSFITQDSRSCNNTHITPTKSFQSIIQFQTKLNVRNAFLRWKQTITSNKVIVGALNFYSQHSTYSSQTTQYSIKSFSHQIVRSQKFVHTFKKIIKKYALKEGFTAMLEWDVKKQHKKETYQTYLKLILKLERKSAFYKWQVYSYLKKQQYIRSLRQNDEGLKQIAIFMDCHNLILINKSFQDILQYSQYLIKIKRLKQSLTKYVEFTFQKIGIDTLRTHSKNSITEVSIIDNFQHTYDGIDQQSEVQSIVKTLFDIDWNPIQSLQLQEEIINLDTKQKGQIFIKSVPVPHIRNFSNLDNQISLKIPLSPVITRRQKFNYTYGFDCINNMIMRASFRQIRSQVAQKSEKLFNPQLIEIQESIGTETANEFSQFQPSQFKSRQENLTIRESSQDELPQLKLVQSILIEEEKVMNQSVHGEEVIIEKDFVLQFGKKLLIAQRRRGDQDQVVKTKVQLEKKNGIKEKVQEVSLDYILETSQVTLDADNSQIVEQQTTKKSLKQIIKRKTAMVSLMALSALRSDKCQSFQDTVVTRKNNDDFFMIINEEEKQKKQGYLFRAVHTNYDENKKHQDKEQQSLVDEEFLLKVQNFHAQTSKKRFSMLYTDTRNFTRSNTRELTVKQNKRTRCVQILFRFKQKKALTLLLFGSLIILIVYYYLFEMN